jgi:hypothetical protein
MEVLEVALPAVFNTDHHLKRARLNSQTFPPFEKVSKC